MLGCKTKSPVVSIILLSKEKSSKTILPEPLARSSRLLLLTVVVIKLSSIKILPVEKVLACTVPVTLILATDSVPLTARSLVIVTSLLGIIILPLPFARNSKSAFDVVVEITLPSTSISSNCTLESAVSACVTDTSPVTSKLPVSVKLPTNVTVPVILVFASVDNPLTVKLLSTCTLLLGTSILPVPLARNSKSAFDTVVVIKLVLILISSTSTSSTYKFNHTFESVPKLYELFVAGIKLLLIPATI